MSKDLDKKVAQLKQQVEQKKKDLGNTPRQNWCCASGVLMVHGDRLVIQTCQDFDKLATAAATLLDYSRHLEEGRKVLDLPKEDPTYNNYLVSDWIKDLKHRVAVLKYKQEQHKIKMMESKLADLTSEQELRRLEIEALEKELTVEG
jgi:hypothetical protein